MRTGTLGNSDLQVSEICLGTMTFGQQNTISEAHEQLDLALDRGVNFIDAAEMYPVPARAQTQGRTESYIGEWLAKGRRDRVVLATKVAGGGRPIDWIRGGSLRVNRAHVEQAISDSLRRLQTDYVDLYQIHWPDRYVPQFGVVQYELENERPSTPTAEQVEVIAQLIKEGKVRHWGLSNETPWGIAEFSRVAAQLGAPAPVSIQNAYNLINRVYEGSHAEAARHEGVDLLAYSPLAFGLLSGKYVDATPPNTRVTLFDGFGARYDKVNVRPAVAEYVRIARKYELSPSQVALAFVRSRWFVRSTIIGATTRAQLEENLDSITVELPTELLAELDEVHARFPSPAP